MILLVAYSKNSISQISSVPFSRKADTQSEHTLVSRQFPTPDFCPNLPEKVQQLAISILLQIEFIPMISFETHSKQLTLLKDYITALEREMNARIIQCQQMQKAFEVSLENEKKAFEICSRVQEQNKYLRHLLSQREQQIVSLQGLKNGYNNLQENTGMTHFQKMELLRKIKEVSESNSNIMEQNKKLSQQIYQITSVLEQERQRWGLQIKIQKSREQQQSRLNSQNLEEMGKLMAKIIEMEKQNKHLSLNINDLQQRNAELQQNRKETSNRMNQIDRTMMTNTDSYNQTLIGKDSEIERNKNEKEHLCKELYEKDIQNNALKEELNKLKQNLHFAEQELEKLKNKNKMMNLQFPQIAQKNDQILELRKKYQQATQRIEQREHFIRQAQRQHRQYIEDLQQKYNEIFKRNRLQLAQLNQQRLLFEERYKNQEKKMRSQIKQSSMIQQEQKKKIVELYTQIDLKQKRIHDLEIAMKFQHLHKPNTAPQQILFNESIQQLEAEVISQKGRIENLTVYLEQKQKEVDTLEDSNGVLRRLIVSSMSNEQKIVQELKRLKRNVSNPSTKMETLTQIHFDATDYLKKSNAMRRRLRSHRTSAKIDSENEILFNKRAAPSQCFSTQEVLSIIQLTQQ